MAHAANQFLLAYSPDDDADTPPAVLTDNEGLLGRLLSDLRALEADQISMDELSQIYRFVPGVPAQLEPLSLARTTTTPYSDDNWASSEWDLTGPDGTRWASLSIAVDGRR